MSGAVLQRFGVTADDRLGGGGEADVFALDDQRVLRVYKRPAGGFAARLSLFYDWLAGIQLPFAVPSVLDWGEHDGRSWSIDRRLPGTSMFALLPSLSEDDRAVAINAYVRATHHLAAVRPAIDGFGDLLAEDPLRTASWPEFLISRLAPAAARATADLAGDGVAVGPVLAAVEDGLTLVAGVTAPSLVHGDWYPGNVMMTDDLTVSGVIDFSSITFAGDPLMDLAGAVVFADAAAWPRPEQIALALAAARSLGDERLDDLIAFYRRWYALYFAQYRGDDERLYQWCVQALRAQ